MITIRAYIRTPVSILKSKKNPSKDGCFDFDVMGDMECFIEDYVSALRNKPEIVDSEQIIRHHRDSYNHVSCYDEEWGNLKGAIEVKFISHFSNPLPEDYLFISSNDLLVLSEILNSLENKDED